MAICAALNRGLFREQSSQTQLSNKNATRPESTSDKLSDFLVNGANIMEIIKRMFLRELRMKPQISVFSFVRLPSTVHYQIVLMHIQYIMHEKHVRTCKNDVSQKKSYNK